MIITIYVTQQILHPDMSLYPWQEQIVEQCRDASDDTPRVLWIIDKQGNSGKSYLARFLQEQVPGVSRLSCDVLDVRILLDRVGDISRPIIIFDAFSDDMHRLTQSVRLVYESLVLQGKKPYILVFEYNFPVSSDSALFQVALLHNTQASLEYVNKA